jgi:hypothetical protein
MLLCSVQAGSEIGAYCKNSVQHAASKAVASQDNLAACSLMYLFEGFEDSGCLGPEIPPPVPGCCVVHGDAAICGVLPALYQPLNLPVDLHAGMCYWPMYCRSQGIDELFTCHLPTKE